MTDRLAWRQPTPADARALGLMHHRAWVDTYAPLLPAGWFDAHGPEEHIEVWRQRLAEPLGPDVSRVAVFAPDGAVAGWAVAGPGRVNVGVPPVREHALWALYVARPLLGTGLGQQLLEWAVGDRPAELRTARGNGRAVAFYRRNGFTEDGAAVEDGHLPLVEVRMVRRAGAAPALHPGRGASVASVG